VTGKNNYLCVSESFPDEFGFHSDGDLEEDSEDCLRIYEPKTPEWNNNFLCLSEMEEKKVFGSRVLGQWQGVHGRVKVVSAGAYGVWGVNAEGLVFFREGVTDEKYDGTGWKLTGSPHKIHDLSVGVKSIYALSITGIILAREGVSAEKPRGDSWKELDKPAAPSVLHQISVSSDNDEVWATSKTNEVFYREGIEEGSPYGASWVKANGKLKWISAGQAGIWGVAPNDQVLYRTDSADTYGRGNEITKVSLRGYHGKYLSVDRSEKLVQGPKRGSGEEFEVIFLGDFQIALKSVKTGRYVSAKSNTQMDVDKVELGDSEKFTVKRVNEHKIGLLGAFKKYVSFVSNGNVANNVVWLRGWEEITVEVTNGGNFWTPLGEGWELVDGALVKLESAYGTVWGVNKFGSIYSRLGITEDKPSGQFWKIINGNKYSITSSSTTGYMWGANQWGGIYARIPSTKYVPGAGLYWMIQTGRLQDISIGQCGLWGTHSGGVWYREGTYDNDGLGTKWTSIRGLMIKVSAGIDVVWGTNPNGVFVRSGITDEQHIGITWEKVKDSPAGLDIISVNSANNDVWATTKNQIYHREGITLENPMGIKWKLIDGNMKYVSVGSSGVWALENSSVRYRTGTRDSDRSDGTGWTNVDGATCFSIASGYNLVLCQGPHDFIYARVGISDENPTGTDWKKIDGQLTKISMNSMQHAVWGVNRGLHIYKRIAVGNEV